MHTALLALAVAALLAGLLHDLAARTIPDTVPAVIAAAGALVRVLDGDLLGAVLAMVLFVAAGSLCWRLGAIGGGDVKLFGATGLLLPPGAVPGLLLAIGVSGVVLACPYWLLNGRLCRARPAGRDASLGQRILRAERFRLRRGGPLPYSAAIMAGVLLSLGSAAW